MDTSEAYIKMCDCEEIQGQKPRMGIVPPTNEDTFISLFACYWAGDFDWVKQQSRYIWLPRQDQLQEMVREDTLLTPDRIHIVFSYWLEGEQIKPDDECSTTRWKHGYYYSFEQLWLAFVMKEKYNKVWDGKFWSTNATVIM